MELKFVEHKEAQDERGKYTRDEYRIGNYVVFRELSVYNTGSTFESFGIRANREIDFLPDIYYNYSLFDDDGRKREFKIQTTSYGSLYPNEIQQVIAGYKEAVEVVNVLTDKFLK